MIKENVLQVSEIAFKKKIQSRFGINSDFRRYEDHRSHIVSGSAQMVISENRDR